MPVHMDKDEFGWYYQWGNHGKKYYFDETSQVSRDKAHEKAVRQGIAVHATGWREK